MTTSNSELMSLSKVASYLGMAERTIYLWAQQGRVPAFKLGTSWRFRRSEIDAWLETQRSGPEVSNNLMVDPTEPPNTKRQIRMEEEAATEALIAACIAFINATMQTDDRDVWTIEQFVDRFGEDVVEQSLKRLRSQRKIRVGDERGLDSERVKVIRRRG